MAPYLLTDPKYLTLAKLFDAKNCFEIPKYQRGFAWDDEQVEDFIKDVGQMFSLRKESKSQEHFFGAVVTVGLRKPGASRQSFEVIDGQQRLVAFRILAACLRNITLKIKEEAEENDDQAAASRAQRTIDELRVRYDHFQDEVNRKVEDVHRLKLSEADHNFFLRLIEGRDATPGRESHRRLSRAYSAIKMFTQSSIRPSEFLSSNDLFPALVAPGQSRFRRTLREVGGFGSALAPSGGVGGRFRPRLRHRTVAAREDLPLL